MIFSVLHSILLSFVLNHDISLADDGHSVMLCKRVMESCFLSRQCLRSGLKETSPDIN